MAIHGNTWQYMAIHGNTCKPISEAEKAGCARQGSTKLCDRISTQQVITYVIYMTLVDPYLHVLPCNNTKITGNCMCKHHEYCGSLPTHIAM